MATPFFEWPTGIPVVETIAKCMAAEMVEDAMNTIKRLVFGVLSCLLLAVGFARAADRLDPMTQSLHPNGESIGTPQASCIGCIGPCLEPSQET